jgi:protein-arginine kinase activator protein McsA
MRWTQTEIDLILSLVRDGKTYKEISIITGRNESSIRSQLFKLGEKWTNHVTFIKEHVCPQCGKKFNEVKHIVRKFCSRSCSVTFTNIENGKKIREITNCLNCKKEIKGKYCSSKCQKEYVNIIMINLIFTTS